jgi:hypothetical protein
MEKDTPDDKLQALMLVQIYCSFYRSSHYVYNSFSLKELSIDVHKLLGSYNNQREDNLREFDNCSSETTTSKKFRQRKNDILGKLDRLIDEINVTIPLPRMDESKNIEKPYEIDDNFKFRIESELVEKWYGKYGRECYNFQYDDLHQVLIKVKEAGRYEIKDGAMQHVAEVTLLEGTFQYYKEFKSVPEACRYYDKILGDKVTRAAIKKKIETHVRIIENGEELKWKVINKRVNAWVDYESKRYNRDKIPNE